MSAGRARAGPENSPPAVHRPRTWSHCPPCAAFFTPPAEGLYSPREAEAPGLALGLLLVPWVLASAGALHVRHGLPAGAPSPEGAAGRLGSQKATPTALHSGEGPLVLGLRCLGCPHRRPLLLPAPGPTPAGFLAFGMRTALAASALTVVLLVLQLPAGELLRVGNK